MQCKKGLLRCSLIHFMSIRNLRRIQLLSSYWQFIFTNILHHISNCNTTLLRYVKQMVIKFISIIQRRHVIHLDEPVWSMSRDAGSGTTFRTQCDWSENWYCSSVIRMMYHQVGVQLCVCVLSLVESGKGPCICFNVHVYTMSWSHCFNFVSFSFLLVINMHE